MKTKAEYDAAVKGPGKFEGEPGWALYFWEHYLDGFNNGDDGTWLTFEVVDADRVIFPELKGILTVKLMESDDGFISTELD